MKIDNQIEVAESPVKVNSTKLIRPVRKIKKKIIRNTEKPIQKYRFIIQLVFIALCIWIGVDFYLFAHYLETGGAAHFYSRPPGVDGFLPISSFMSFYLFLKTGVIHSAHPAGVFIFLAIVLMSLVFGKSFCSWLCPIGTISELIGDFGEKIMKKISRIMGHRHWKGKIYLPKWVDYPMRSIKYLLLGFLFYAVFVLMSTLALKAFLGSPYNQVADIKMYFFFANISETALIVLGVLFILSIFIRNFWCRFLCPYGALLGIFSFLSPYKIKRNPISCIDCGLCNKACPSAIKVDQVKTVFSDECTTCMSCVDACPVADTLELKSVFTKKKVSKKYVAVGVVAIFLVVTGFAMLKGHWQNDISKKDYLILYKNMDSFGHPTNPDAFKKLDKEAAIQGNKKLNDKNSTKFYK